VSATPGRSLYSEALPSQLVRYESTPTTTTTTVTPPPAATTTTTTAAASPPLQQAPARATAVATVPPATTPDAPVVSSDSERGQATWYAAAPAGMCASPTLPFGTVLTVTNVATGASTTCTVDDREQAGYPRVVDMSPSGFAQLADPSEGVVDVTISW
jgi:rare lipoprotein A (peptidoglycan hydrolase)